MYGTYLVKSNSFNYISANAYNFYKSNLTINSIDYY